MHNSKFNDPLGEHFCAYCGNTSSTRVIQIHCNDSQDIMRAKIRCDSCGHEDWPVFRQSDFLSWVIRDYMHRSNITGPEISSKNAVRLNELAKNEA